MVSEPNQAQTVTATVLTISSLSLLANLTHYYIAVHQQQTVCVCVFECEV